MGTTFLTSDALKEFLSEYLDRGYKDDTVVIRWVEIERDVARATLDVTEYFAPGDGGYHFTSLHAMIIVSQVGIILASRANGFETKPGEIYMRDFSILCRRKINKVCNIEMSLELRKAVRTKHDVLYDIEYQFESRAFTGSLRCLFPLVPRVVQQEVSQ